MTFAALKGSEIINYYAYRDEEQAQKFFDLGAMGDADSFAAVAADQPHSLLPGPDPAPPTLDGRVCTLEAENAQLSAKLSAALQSSAMMEECLIEMAGIVYS